MVSETCKNPLGMQLQRVFCFQRGSVDFIESHAFVGSFVGIWVYEEYRYQQLLKASYNWLTSNKLYNLKSISGVLEAFKESAFVAVNKWRKFTVSRWSCDSLDQYNSFFSSLRKAIHPVSNPQFTLEPTAINAVAAYPFVSTHKRGER